MKKHIKNLAKTFSLLVITAISLNIVQAQPQGGQQGPPPVPNSKQIAAIISDLSKTLDLSDNQYKTISDLYTAHFNEVKVKTESGRPNREEMESLKAAFEKKVKAVLTSEQQEKYTTYLKNNSRNQRGQQRPNRE